MVSDNNSFVRNLLAVYPIGSGRVAAILARTDREAFAHLRICAFARSLTLPLKRAHHAVPRSIPWSHA
jgi:hypothetical protein